MKKSSFYLMENEDEAIRLEVKTDRQAVVEQAKWCGISPGFRVLDAGCGPGITTSILHDMVQPSGNVVGVDYSEKRIEYATRHYSNKAGIEFHLHDLREPLNALGEFDLIWIRFVLEYHRVGSLDIIKNLTKCLKPDGILCLLDLDYNCLSHYELPPAIAGLLPKLMDKLDEEFNFDTFIGRKLYAYLYDHGFEDIQMNLMPHHLIYGDNISDGDIYNWFKKVEIAAKRLGDYLVDYPGGPGNFSDDFKKFFLDRRRFTYTPLILSKGKKPSSS